MSNGFLSQRLVGKARYLDFREDEQSRGITMKSAGVTLYHVYGGAATADIAAHEFVITLLDSPGHVDFAAEVSAAARLSDGSLIVVDVVEGVCSQTRAVLHQAMSEGLQPILVLNKIDRLFLELQLDADEAYIHLRRVLEDANAVLGAYLAEQRLRLEEQATLCENEPSKPLIHSRMTEMADEGAVRSVSNVDSPRPFSSEEKECLFEPATGNVIFASALDGWAFRLSDLIRFVTNKFGIRREVLEQTLWGDFYIHAKTKKVMPAHKNVAANGRPPRTLFGQFALEPIAHLYRYILTSAADEAGRRQRQHLVDRLGIVVPERDLFHRDARYALQSVLSRWLPLSRTILDAVVDQVPAAHVANGMRLRQLWPHDPEESDWAQKLASAMIQGDTSDAAPIMISVSKVMGIDDSAFSTLELPKTSFISGEQEPAGSRDDGERDAQPRTGNDKQVQLALGRVLCGAVSASMSFGEIYIYGPRYRADNPGTFGEPFCVRLTHGRLEAFILNGRDVVPVLHREMKEEATSGARLAPGTVVAFYGVGASVLKTATISSLPPGKCLQFAGLARHGHGRPVVFVALEPAERLADLAQLRHGVRLLNQADPAVETFVSESGELVLGVSGELHLQRCLRDLEERFAGVPVKCSAPMVALRETVAGGVSASPTNPWVIEQQRYAENADEIMKPSSGEIIGQVVAPSTRLGSITEHLRKVSINDHDRGAFVPDPSASVVERTPANWLASGSYWEDHRRALRGGGVIPVPLAAYAVTLYIYAVPLPRNFVEAFESASRSALRSLFLGSSEQVESPAASETAAVSELVVRLHRAVMEDAGYMDSLSRATSGLPPGRAEAEVTAKREVELLFHRLIKHAVALGPHDIGSNVLLAPEGALAEQLQGNPRSTLTSDGTSRDPICDPMMISGGDASSSEHSGGTRYWYRIRDAFRRIWGRRLDSNGAFGTETLPAAVLRALVSAFQVVSAAGPLAEEPLQGVCFIVHAADGDQALPVTQTANTTTATMLNRSAAAPAAALISQLTEALKRAVLAANPRLAEPLFQTEIQCSSNALGRVHTVLSAARAQVLSEQIKEYRVTSTFFIRALVPASSTFGFAEKIRRASSGAAGEVELQFLGAWHVLEQDPFWSPATAEELELLGAEDLTATSNNLARSMMDQVRARKGHRVAYKLVERAEKQRTLARKK
jgi:small GTP-binding protein